MVAFAVPSIWVSGQPKCGSSVLNGQLVKHQCWRASSPSPAKTFAIAAQTLSESESSENEVRNSRAFNKTGTIIVPGKFDAFHLGHRELARAAASMGSPTLLSFSGMAEVLRWPPRAPVVAAVERDRILRSWSITIGEQIVWRVLPFPEIQDQNPEEFLEMLSKRFQAKGIVCGGDWRFGRQAVGDVELLKQLAPRHGLDVHVVNAVDIGDGGGVVSSTRVRAALANGKVGEATQLLGRPHRLVGYVVSLGDGLVNCNRFVNQVPGDGDYWALVRVIGRSEPFRAVVRVKRPQEADPLTPVSLLEDPGAVLVQIEDAEQIYCADCEVYLDFVEQID